MVVFHPAPLYGQAPLWAAVSPHEWDDSPGPQDPLNLQVVIIIRPFPQDL